ncbi:hypothetical protein G6F70_000344 [Rhizopus microsporus]|nr:hypothetical protein G6F71_004121 [Rhizopus microsporus]KAG1204606.1 hypothetical protein G6F70_000344 [Rhizopus microsporus]KAG1212010.1 hypothetical protein G6F69_004072 [Rhizopus microsporus]KAG1235070.1 hypothetical protein G6F67_003034 [Rhizopus microsporus]KAG1259345.1 hypothetical protein G6F68_008178 [Rhizopus microsporus]
MAFTENDDNVPLYYLVGKNDSSDEEDSDQDLVPLAFLNSIKLKSAAEKYKEKVKQQFVNSGRFIPDKNANDDDDNVPLSQACRVK